MSTDIITSALPINGYGNVPVANTFLRQEQATDHLVIILPGYSYSPDLPVLYYPSLVMLTHGADVLRVRYAYDSDPTFREVSVEERGARIGADVEAAARAGLEQRDYKRMTLIGKSLGTVAMAHLLAANEQLRGASCIWLTPLLRDKRLRQAAASFRPRSLFVIGTADLQYDADLLAEVVVATEGTQLIIEGANHGLEIQGDVRACIDALSAITQAVDDFV